VEWFRLAGIKPPGSAFVATGCPACGHTGYRGRTGVFELWYLDEEAYRQILDHADEHRLRAWLASRGHRSLLHQGLDKVQQGVTSMQELKRFLPALKLSHAPQAR
jgi:type II secretory ATPase GspE/PulE/Tfp pilus assembly ATPase PilB-like protein